MPEVQQDAGRKDRPKHPSGSPTLRPNPISLPKNRSTGNLARDLAFTPLTAIPRTRTESLEETTAPNPRSRFSIDGSSLSHRDALMLSPLITEPEHGFGISGLRRIRQGAPSRAASRAPSGTVSRTPTAPPSPETRFEPFLSRASSMNLHVSAERGFSIDGAGPTMSSFGEDLQRFPSESLHSFSFAYKSEEILHNRVNVLKKSLEFMRDRPGWASSIQHLGLMMAHAKVTGDHDLYDVLAFLHKSNILDGERAQALGAMTGPIIIDGENIFDRGFATRSESPDYLDESLSSSPKSRSVSLGTLSRKQEGGISPTNETSSKSDKVEARTPTEKNERNLSPPANNIQTRRSVSSSRPTFKRTFTDIKALSLQTQLSDILAKPYNTHDSALDSALLSPSLVPPFAKTGFTPTTPGGSNHAATRWQPASQAIFTTSTTEPWTILAANDLACLVFGVTRAEIRKLGIMEVIRNDRRDWLKTRLEIPRTEASAKIRNVVTPRSRNSSTAATSNLAISKGGITAMLLSKPPARQQAAKRSQSDATQTKTGQRRASANETNRPRGVLLCGDIVPIQKRNGITGSASLWVKEKKGYLIWVLEEIIEDTTVLTLDETGSIISASGAISSVWGQSSIGQGTQVSKLIPKIPVTRPLKRAVDYSSLGSPVHLTARRKDGFNVPVCVSANRHLGEVSVTSFPHMAGIVVLCADDLRITSANSVFTTSLFGMPEPNGMHITDLIPQFVKLLDVVIEEGEGSLGDGSVVPEHSFRRARVHLAFREDATNAAETIFLKPAGLPAKHVDGSEFFVDVQMRVVKSDISVPEEAIIEEKDDEELHERDEVDLQGRQHPELVYALWITYSRHIHSIGTGTKTPLASRPSTPPRQPSPGQAIAIIESSGDERRSTGDTLRSTQMSETSTESVLEEPKGHKYTQSQIERDIKEATSEPISIGANKAVIEIKPEPAPDSRPTSPKAKAIIPPVKEKPKKKTIDDFVIIEDMGQGAYGQVKLARYKEPPGDKVVLKYVTKKRILVDTWMRDRKLGTVPSEIHVLNYLKKDGMRHPNIVEMIDFFEDKDYYYIMMVPHGLPGMDLFDYIEMRPSMEEAEVHNIFIQVVDAVHHLHEAAEVVHRDIKDENIILDGENKVKLIDFGSAAYTRNGPFDVFVGTIAPEVITGQSYKGKPQDIWALGILLYTLVYKENPFYNVDEILERDLRVPYIMSEGCLDLIRSMLNREVGERYTIQQVVDHPWTKGEGLGVGRSGI